MAFVGVGTTFSRWNTATSSWERLAEIRSITGPGFTRETIDTTTLDTTGGYRTFIAGFRNSGTVGLEMNFTRDAFEKMKADFESDVIQNYEILLPDVDHTSLEFEGFVSECPLTIPEALVSLAVKIQISGPVAFDSGSQAGSA